MNIINFDIKMGLLVLGTVSAIVGIFIVAAHLDNKARSECESKGGQYVVSHYYITMVYSGKVMIPVNNPVYKCKLK